MSRVVCVVLLVAAWLSAWPCLAAELVLNLIAVNASEDQERDISVKYPLPQELEPSDIIDSGELKIEYDVEKGSYYAHGNIKFQPKESKTFKIRVNDVWVIKPDEIASMKTTLDGNLSLLKKRKELYDTAKAARDKIHGQLDFIAAQQENYSENIERRIEQYRAYVAILEKLREKVYDPNFLEKESGGIVSEETGTIKFVIDVKNPSEEGEKTVKHKHYLPAEIREEDVLDKQGFDVRFDEKKGKTFLSKEETFKPGESKKYTILLKDVWKFPLSQLEPVRQRADIAMAEIRGSIYAASGEFLYAAISQALSEIAESQSEGVPTEQHIGLSRVNEKRYQQASEDLDRLEKMLAIVRAKKLEALESGKVKNVLSKLQALRGLQSLSETIFKQGISVTMTWKIIMGMIIFIAVFTTVHFVLWARRSKNMGEEMGLNEGESLKTAARPAPQKEA